MREDDVVDLGVVAGVPQLGGERARVDPVDVAERRAAEEVRGVRGQRDRGDPAEDLCRAAVSRAYTLIIMFWIDIFAIVPSPAPMSRSLFGMVWIVLTPSEKRL